MKTITIPYPLVNVYITMERSTIFDGKKLIMLMVIFHSYVYVYQRVNHPIKTNNILAQVVTARQASLSLRRGRIMSQW